MNGFLLVTLEPPAPIEEEFNDWYDNEHVPERIVIPGFLTARRFVCTSGWPRYLAVYDLRDIGVLSEPAYKATSGDKFSVWSKRILPRVRGQYRASGDQVYPGNAITSDFCRMLVIRLRKVPASAEAAVIERARAQFEGRHGVKQVRVFKNTERADLDYIVTVESAVPFPPDLASKVDFGDLTHSIDMVNEYSQYWVRGPLHGVFSEK